MSLRDYQIRAVEWDEATLSALRAAGKRTSVVNQLSTGGGKSRIIKALSPDIVIAPGIDLVRQLQGTIPGAAIYTTTALATRLRNGLSLPAARRVAVDEARCVCAPGLSPVVEWYLERGAEIIMFDATPATATGQGLGRWADALLQVASMRELIQGGHLVPFRVLAPAQPQRELAARPVDAWRNCTPGESGIAYCEHKAHARKTADEFVAAGVPCAVLTDDTPRGERAKIIADLDSGALRIVANAQILRQGIDVPRVSSIILARAVLSYPLFMQAIGRGGRPHAVSGKQRCTVLDLRGNSHTHGLPEDDRIWSLDGVACRPALEALPACVQCKACLGWGRGGWCASCGAELPPPPLPRVKAADLVEVRAAKDTDERKAEVLRRFVQEAYKAARVRGKSGAEAERSAWAGSHRYQGTYGVKPASRDVLAAIREAREAWARTAEQGQQSLPLV